MITNTHDCMLPIEISPPAAGFGWQAASYNSDHIGEHSHRCAGFISLDPELTSSYVIKHVYHMHVFKLLSAIDLVQLHVLHAQDCHMISAAEDALPRHPALPASIPNSSTLIVRLDDISIHILRMLSGR